MTVADLQKDDYHKMSASEVVVSVPPPPPPLKRQGSGGTASKMKIDQLERNYIDYHLRGFITASEGHNEMVKLTLTLAVDRLRIHFEKSNYIPASTILSMTIMRSLERCSPAFIITETKFTSSLLEYLNLQDILHSRTFDIALSFHNALCGKLEEWRVQNNIIDAQLVSNMAKHMWQEAMEINGGKGHRNWTQSGMYTRDTLKKVRHILKKQIARKIKEQLGGSASVIDDQINSELNAIVSWAATKQLQAKGLFNSDGFSLRSKERSEWMRDIKAMMDDGKGIWITHNRGAALQEEEREAALQEEELHLQKLLVIDYQPKTVYETIRLMISRTALNPYDALLESGNLTRKEDMKSQDTANMLSILRYSLPHGHPAYSYIEVIKGIRNVKSHEVSVDIAYLKRSTDAIKEFLNLLGGVTAQEIDEKFSDESLLCLIASDKVQSGRRAVTKEIERLIESERMEFGIWMQNIPSSAHHSTLTGRGIEIEQVNAVFHSDSSDVHGSGTLHGPDSRVQKRVQVLCGMGGIGKSTIAASYCEQYKDLYNKTGVFWINADSKASMDKSFREIATKYLYFKRFSDDAEDVNTYIRELVYAVFVSRTGWLLVFDNFDNPQLLDYIPHTFIESMRGDILITSRSYERVFINRFGTIVNCLSLETLNERDSKVLLWRQAQKDNRYPSDEAVMEALSRASDSEQVYIEKLCGAAGMGGLPLALVQAGSYIFNTQQGGSRRFELYWEDFSKAENSLFNSRGIRNQFVDCFSKFDLADYVDSVISLGIKSLGQVRTMIKPRHLEAIGITSIILIDRFKEMQLSIDEAEIEKMQASSIGYTFLRNYREICLRYPASAVLLRKCAFLHPDAISLSLLNADKDEGMTESQIRNDLSHLQERGSLITFSKDTQSISIHRVLQRALQKEIETSGDVLLKTYEACIADVSTVYGTVSKEYISKANLIVYEVVAHATALTVYFNTQYSESAHYKSLSNAIKKSLILSVCKLNDLCGDFHGKKGDFSQSKENFAHSYELKQKLYGANVNTLPTVDKLDLATSMFNLGVICNKKGEYIDSEKYLKEVGEIRKAEYAKVNNGKHVEVAAVLYQQANMYFNVGNFEQANTLYKESIEIYKKCFEIKKDGCVEKLCATATATKDMANEEIGDICCDIGKVETNVLNADGARISYEKALSIFKNCFGSDSDHPKIAKVLCALGHLNIITRDHATAEAFFNEALGMLQRCLGDMESIESIYFRKDDIDSPTAAASAHFSFHSEGMGSASSLSSQNSPLNAKTITRKYVKHIDVADALRGLGVVKVHAKNFLLAAGYLKDALRIYGWLYVDEYDDLEIIRTEGNHPSIASAIHEVGVLYLEQDDSTDAMKWLSSSRKMNLKIYKFDASSLRNFCLSGYFLWSLVIVVGIGYLLSLVASMDIGVTAPLVFYSAYGGVNGSLIAVFLTLNYPTGDPDENFGNPFLLASALKQLSALRWKEGSYSGACATRIKAYVRGVNALTHSIKMFHFCGPTFIMAAAFMFYKYYLQISTTLDLILTVSVAWFTILTLVVYFYSVINPLGNTKRVERVIMGALILLVLSLVTSMMVTVENHLKCYQSDKTNILAPPVAGVSLDYKFGASDTCGVFCIKCGNDPNLDYKDTSPLLIRKNLWRECPQSYRDSKTWIPFYTSFPSKMLSQPDRNEYFPPEAYLDYYSCGGDNNCNGPYDATICKCTPLMQRVYNCTLPS